MSLNEWHSFQRILACISVVLLIICFLGFKDIIRASEQWKNVDLAAPTGSGKYENVKYETYNLPKNQIRWAQRKSFSDTDELVKGRGVIYYYYVLKRVR